MIYLPMSQSASDKSVEKLSTLLIWDKEVLPEITSGKVALWRSFGDSVSPNVVSIPALVEKNADTLRQRYLAWIYALGETKIQGRSLVDHLELRPGFSYWWMTLSVGKCNYSISLQIGNAFKLMAFEGWLVGQTFTNIKLVSANAPLAQCINAWCVNTGLIFEWQSLPEKAEQVSWLRRFYHSLPCKLKALTWLIHYLVQRWPLKGVGLQEWRQSKGVVTFVSYLFNLAPDAVNVGKFESRYWAHLPDALQRDDCKTNWLHMYVKDALIPNASKAAAVIRQFNATGKGDQVHVTLDTFLGWRVVYRGLRDWCVVRRAVVKFRNMPISNATDTIDFWPLFADDWQQSFVGVGALSNLLNLNLYEAALSTLPAQRIGVYLQENQGWEIALVHAWKAAGHVDLIGSPNASVRFWDLRYFFDPRSYNTKMKNNLPMPDLVAVNGSAAMRAYLGGNYPASDLLEVEALRYLYLAEYSVAAPKVTRPTGGPLSVLAMGDYLLDNTQLQMHLLEQAATLLPQDTVFVIKPHPNCPLNPADYPGLSMTVTMEPLSTLLAKCDVAYSSSLTAAAVDAYCMGVPIISVLDPSKLNMSPLIGYEDVTFVSSPEELAAVLNKIDDIKEIQEQGKDYFYLEAKLPRWRELLINNGKARNKIVLKEVLK